MYANCWEARSCPPDRRDSCPAYPQNGKKCWLVFRTLCRGEVQGKMPEKVAKCFECSWFKILYNVK